MIEIIPVEQGLSLSDYASYAHLTNAVDELKSEAAQLVPSLEGRTVWMVNSTARGGGVAEMLPRMVALMRELGVSVEWVVIGTDRMPFFDLTKNIHNMIHGAGPTEVSEEDRALYQTVSQELADELEGRISPGDILVVHDPQPAGMGALLNDRLDIVSMWRCHIGLDQQTPQTEAVWDFLEPFVNTYDQTIFSAPEYIPRFLSGNVTVIAPAIDPLTPKNVPLSAHKLAGLLCNSGFMPHHEPVLTPDFVHRAERLQPDGTFAAAGDGDDPIGLLFRPTVTQISRWDRLKGWKPLLDAFVHLKRGYERIPDLSDRDRRRLSLVRLVFAGPEPAAIQDDPEAKDVLEELKAAYVALEPDIQRDVALISLPMTSLRENALMVNALQQCSTIVVQNSLQEGFGLTVTEAMWKGVPVLGSHACGIRQQITDGTDGRLTPDAEDHEAIADIMLEMLNDASARHRWGRRGQRRVRDEFLVFSQLRKWLRALSETVARGTPPPTRTSRIPPPPE